MQANFQSKSIARELVATIKSEMKPTSTHLHQTMAQRGEVAPTSKTLLSLKQSAKKLNISLNTVRNWSSTNSKYFRPDFPKIRRVGERRVAILEAEIDAFIDQCIRVG